MSRIDNFLDWMVDTKGVSERQLWKVPMVFISVVAYFLIMMGIGFVNVYGTQWLFSILVGVLLFILCVLSALNWESKEFGRYKWLRKKIF